MTQHAEFYRNAIDLNRYSNGVARRVVRAYNDVIIDATDRLAMLDPESISAARLRAILAQLKESLDGWAGTSTLLMTCLLYTSPSPRDRQKSRMPSSA